MSLGGGEILVILLVALVVFGPNRLPELSRQVGGVLRDLKKMQDNVKREISDVINLESPRTPSGASSAPSGHSAPPPNYDNPDSYRPLDDEARDMGGADHGTDPGSDGSGELGSDGSGELPMPSVGAVGAVEDHPASGSFS